MRRFEIRMKLPPGRPPSCATSGSGAIASPTASPAAWAGGRGKLEGSRKAGGAQALAQAVAETVEVRVERALVDAQHQRKPGDGSASPEPEVQQVLVFGRQLAHDPAQDRDHRASAERVHDAEAGAPERGQREQGAEPAAEEGEEGRLDHEREGDRPAREAERLERALADAPRRKKEKMREKRSGHIVDAFFSWCDAEAPSVLEDTPIAAGIRYAR